MKERYIDNFNNANLSLDNENEPRVLALLSNVFITLGLI